MKQYCERCRQIYGKIICFYDDNAERCKCGTFLSYFPDVTSIDKREDEISTPVSKEDTTMTVESTNTDNINTANEESPIDVKKSTNVNTTSRPRLVNKAIENKENTKKNISSIVDELFINNGIIGLDLAKSELTRYYNTYDTELLKDGINRKANEDRTINRMSIFIKGEELTGKTELSKILAKLLYKLGIRANETLELVSITEFEAALGDESNIEDLFKPYKGKTVLIDESLDQTFLDTEGKTVIDAPKISNLIRAIRKISDDVTVIFEVTPNLCNEMYRVNSRLNDYFLTLDIGTYSPENLYKIAVKRITEDFKYNISEDGKRQLLNRIKTASFDRYSQGRFILNVFEEAKSKLERRLRMGNNISITDKFTFIKTDFQDKVYNESLVKEVLTKINEKEGQAGIKEYAKKIVDDTKQNYERVLNGKKPLPIEQPNFILEGDTGTGKTTSCKLLSKLLFACGILKYDEPIIVSISDLQTSSVGGTPDKVKAVFEKASGHMLVIDEAYSLVPKGDVSGNYGQEIVDTIVNELGKGNNDLIVVLVGYPGSVDPAVLNMNIGMKGRFPNKISLEPYSLKELVTIFMSHANELNYIVEDGAEVLVEKFIDAHFREQNFSNARGVINLFDRVVSGCNHQREIITKADLMKLIEKDTKGNSVEDIINEINSLIGLESVKELISNLVNQQLGRQKQNKAGLKIGKPLSLNQIYLGPKGTGKTTVARLVGKLYAKMGLIKYSDKFIEVSASNLIAGHVGQTEERVAQLIDDAIGGVLYIDEFYQLNNGTVFGQSAIDALCVGIEARGEDLMVIIAGYNEETIKCLEMNQGLRSRFRTEILFPPYSEEELFEIFKRFVCKYGMCFDEDGEVAIIIKKWIETESLKPDFSNARAVRNCVEDILDRQQARIGLDQNCAVDALNLIISDDIPDIYR